MTTRPLAAAVAALSAITLAASSAIAQRAIGIDVSYWQGGSINWATVARPIAQGGGGVQFAFIRATRGGTGGYADQGGAGYGGYRTDDLYLDRNMQGATSNGILAGAYHFARADVITGRTDAQGNVYTQTNTGLDEANHFLEEAGQYMKAGYIRPVLDLEAGNLRGRTGLTDFAIEFSDRILAVTGVRPIIYANTNYATSYVDSRVSGHDLWLARYMYDSYTPAEAAAAAQVESPPSDSYGVFKTTANPTPWDVWQYSSKGRVPGIGNGAVNVDMNVANGGIDVIRELLVPAIWQSDANGSWQNASNWNGPTAGWLPTANDRVILRRSGAQPRVEISSGAQRARSIDSTAILSLIGGSLTVAEHAQLGPTTEVSGGTLSAASMNPGYLTIGGTGAVNVAGAITGAGNSNVTVTGGSLTAGSLSILSPLAVSGTGLVRLTGNGGNRVTGLSVTGNGAVDLGLGKLVVNYTGATPITAVREGVARGAIDSGKANASLGVGVIEATRAFTSFTSATAWNGVTVDSTSLLIALALFGDTDLNGTVDRNDLAALAASFKATGAGWQHGDFTYDGRVDWADLDLLGANFGRTLRPDGTFTAADPAGFAAALANYPALVPEPATLAAGAAAALATLRRRRPTA